VNRLRSAAAALGRTLGRAARWLFGAFCLTVTSARRDLNRDDVKAVVTKLGAAALTLGGIKAGVQSVVTDPETLWICASTLFVLAGAFVEGLVRYHAGAEAGKTDPPAPTEAPPS
jgi:hypothetical protein